MVMICSAWLGGKLAEEMQRRVALGAKTSNILREALMEYFGFNEEKRGVIDGSQ